MLIDGIHVPLTAPFYRDGQSYLRKLEHNVRRYSLTPAAGLVAMLPGSEGAALSDTEIKRPLDTIASTAAAEKVLIAGIARDSVRAALALAAQAESAGFDALLLAAPTEWPRLRTRAELLVHFRTVADAAPLPVLLWSDPDAPARELTVDEIAELATHHNILGLYDAGLTLERYATIAAVTREVHHEVAVTNVFAPVTNRMMAPELGGAGTFVPSDMLGGVSPAIAVAMPQPAIKMRSKSVGFQIMAAGVPPALLPLLQAGVAGALPALAACAPQACHEVYAAFKDGNPALAVEKPQRLAAAGDLIEELGIAGAKYACDLNGYYGGSPRLPRLALDAPDRDRVDRVMASIKN